MVQEAGIERRAVPDVASGGEVRLEVLVAQAGRAQDEKINGDRRPDQAGLGDERRPNLA